MYLFFDCITVSILECHLDFAFTRVHQLDFKTQRSYSLAVSGLVCLLGFSIFAIGFASFLGHASEVAGGFLLVAFDRMLI